MANNRIIVHVFEKNGHGEVVQVALQEFKGRKFVDVRTWFPDKATGEMRPSPEGLALNLDQLCELLAGLARTT
ncbi:hypothetical protein JCM15519_15330 [Fundidesulfovibrio butyratiphilus]